MPPLIISEEVALDPQSDKFDALDLFKPLGGHLWWNSLYWTNFPPLSILDLAAWEAHKDEEVPAALSLLNSDNQLAEQYMTFGSAREDLCMSREPPAAGFKLTVECMQYEGVRKSGWDFMLHGYTAHRDNHQRYDLQARRFWDNGVMHLGLNAEEFSERVRPVGELDACLHFSDKAATENPTWGYHHVLMRIEGWPYRVKRIGTFEGQGEGGHAELNLGMTYSDDTPFWQLLQGDAEGQTNLKKGFKFWASLLDFDWLSRKKDEKNHFDQEVPVEKGYVWFTVVDTYVVPSTGKKGVKIELLDEGIVPAWMDLNFLQVFAGGMPLGNLSDLESDGSLNGSVAVYRTSVGDAETRKVVVKNDNSKLVFDEPKTMQVNDFVDMGWAIHDACYQGAFIKLTPKAPRFMADVGVDEGMIAYRAAGVSVGFGEGKSKVMLDEPPSDWAHERRLAM